MAVVTVTNVREGSDGVWYTNGDVSIRCQDVAQVYGIGYSENCGFEVYRIVYFGGAYGYDYTGPNGAKKIIENMR